MTRMLFLLSILVLSFSSLADITVLGVDDYISESNPKILEYDIWTKRLVWIKQGVLDQVFHCKDVQGRDYEMTFDRFESFSVRGFSHLYQERGEYIFDYGTGNLSLEYEVGRVMNSVQVELNREYPVLSRIRFQNLECRSIRPILPVRR